MPQAKQRSRSGQWRAGDRRSGPCASRTGERWIARCERAHVGASGARSSAPVGGEIETVSKLDAAILCTQARAALTGLGWKPAIARTAVDAAVAVSGPEMTLERLIFESLRRCPMP